MPNNFIIADSLRQSNLPFFDGGMMIWSGVFIVLSIFLSIMTWRSQSGLSRRSLMYWGVNAFVFGLSIFFFTKAFPRIGAGWVLAIVVIIIFAISGASVVTKTKGGDNKNDKEKGSDKGR